MARKERNFILWGVLIRIMAIAIITFFIIEPAYSVGGDESTDPRSDALGISGSISIDQWKWSRTCRIEKYVEIERGIWLLNSPITASLVSKFQHSHLNIILTVNVSKVKPVRVINGPLASVFDLITLNEVSRSLSNSTFYPDKYLYPFPINLPQEVIKDQNWIDHPYNILTKEDYFETCPKMNYYNRNQNQIE